MINKRRTGLAKKRLLALICVCLALTGCESGNGDAGNAEDTVLQEIATGDAEGPIGQTGAEVTEITESDPGNEDEFVSEGIEVDENTTDAESSANFDNLSGDYDFTLCFAGDINFDEN